MYIEQTNSTNDLIKELGVGKGNGWSIRTDFQTAGKGQAGNGWESEKGKNLLCSVQEEGMLLPMEDAFCLTMKAAIAVWETLREEVRCEELLRIKWPNDVYYGDKKIAGILVESVVEGGKIVRCVIGVGININQIVWYGGAPNPISLRQITGKERDVVAIYERFLLEIEHIWCTETKWTKDIYMQHLYRKEGWFRYVEREVSVDPTSIAGGHPDGEFEARFVDIERSGEIVLEDATKKRKKYHFKQIRYVI